MKALFTESSWPNEGQRLLLRAALLDGTDALVAWEDWRRVVDFEKLDYGSLRLIPLLHRNLRRLGAEDPNLERYAGIRRKAWVSNQRLFHRTAAALRALEAGGIRTLVLKGIPLSLLYYPEPSLRPTVDGDILVPMDRAADAVRILERTGWRNADAPAGSEPAEGDFTRLHSWAFRDAEGTEIDLHWKVINSGLPAGEESEFWRDARPLRLHDVDTLTLGPADHLLHACVHGVPWDPVPSVRWIADAHLIVSRCPAELDWDRLLLQAGKRRFFTLLRPAFEYLREHLGTPLPDGVLSRLAEAKGRRWERAECALVTRPHWQRDRKYRLWLRFRRLRAVSPEWSARAWWTGYVRYLQLYWRLDHPWQLPFAAARRTAGALRHGLFPGPCQE